MFMRYALFATSALGVILVFLVAVSGYTLTPLGGTATAAVTISVALTISAFIMIQFGPLRLLANNKTGHE